MGTYNYTFKSVVSGSVKIKIFSEALGWSKKSFVRRFENETFLSIEIESVVVSAHPQYLDLKTVVILGVCSAISKNN